MRKVATVLCSILFFLSLAGCQKSGNAVLTTAISQLDTSKHTDQLHDYDSPYTICYKNKDGTYSMYIFASPIQYKTRTGKYAVIDNTVVKSEKEGFVYENKANTIKTYFPKTLTDRFLVERGEEFISFKTDWKIDGFSEAKQTVFTNMYGDRVSAVMYRGKGMDMVFYPTKAGIKSEIVLKEKPMSGTFEFCLKTNALSFEIRQNGYILFKEGGENRSIIYQPLVQYTADKKQQLDVMTQMNLEQKGDGYNVEMTIDDSIIENAKYPVKLDPSFEIYLNKIPDSTVYSKHNVNNYLANYAVVGNHPVFGEGWHYVRFRINYIAGFQGLNILSATYNLKCLSGNYESTVFRLHRLEQQWSSTNIFWETKVIPGNTVYSDSNINKKTIISFVLTEYIRSCSADPLWETESKGLILKGQECKESIFIATADNSLYSPYIKLKLDQLPRSFKPMENINPSTENYN